MGFPCRVIAKSRDPARHANFITLGGNIEYLKSGIRGTARDFPRIIRPWTKTSMRPGGTSP
jgi:hypothetical protein